MNDDERLTGIFEEDRPRLRAIAYRMLGSLPDADDAVQDAWERAHRAGINGVGNVEGWLTTIVARVCLNVLRARERRREEPLDGRLPDPVLTARGALLPEEEAMLADSVGLALQAVIGTLPPAERLAFVLHDLFDLPFGEIGQVLGRTPGASRQLASRARRRLQATDLSDLERDPVRQWAVVDAFFAAGREGDFDGLVAVLDPDVVLRADFSPGQPGQSTIVRGAETVARQARFQARSGAKIHPTTVNGGAGVVVTLDAAPISVVAFAVAAGRIVQIDVVGDPQRAARVAAAALRDDSGHR